jgi:hypothetical protein
MPGRYGNHLSVHLSGTRVTDGQGMWRDVYLGRRLSALGQKRTFAAIGDVRFTPESGHVQCKQRCPLRAVGILLTAALLIYLS